MNSGESTAGCSSSERENGAASLDPERPHKKARFPWQIKGKHHLKNQTNERTVSSKVTPDECKTVTAPPTAEMLLRTEPYPRRSIQEILVPSKSLMPANVNYLPGDPTDIPNNADPPLPLETVISLAETMLLNSGLEVMQTGSTSTQDLPRPSNPTHNIKISNSAKEARRLKRNEEKCIARWQATETEKGCFDNTINHILESWMNSPDEGDQRFLATDMARIMNDELNSNDGNVENEGILMAINAHGLQSMGHPTFEPPSTFHAVSQYLNFESESSSSSEDCEILTRSEGLQWPFHQHASTSKEPAICEPWRPVHEIINANPTHQFPAGEDYEYEFMDTAIIQAIKSKGLMVAGTDFG